MKRKLAIEAVFLLSLIFASICTSYITPTLSAETSPCSDCDAPSLETIHNVTVYLVDGEVLLRIEPLTLPEDCGCGDCEECETCPTVEPENVQSTVLEDEDGYTVVLVTYEVNGTTFETTISKTLLWSYSEDAEANRTASFSWMEISGDGISAQFYALSYLVWDDEYNFTVSTWLDPLDPETYNSSFTVLDYVPAEKSVNTLELVGFDSPVTLSEQYAVLGDVAKGMAKHYEKSQNETLQGLAQNYNNIKEEAKYLSKLVQKQLQEYNRDILQSSAIVMDQSLECLICLVHCGLETVACSVVCYDAWILCAVPGLCPIVAATCLLCIAVLGPICWAICTIPC